MKSFVLVHLASLKNHLIFCSPTSTDTRRTRKGTRRGTRIARGTKTAVVTNASAPSARKRKARTKTGNESVNESGRGSPTERKET